MHSFARATYAALAGLMALASFGAGADTIDIPSNGEIEQFWGPSSGGNQSYGQVFSAPQNELLDFSFVLDSTSPYPFVAQVYDWDGSSIVGSPLFTSSITYATPQLEAFSFDADTPLLSGATYIAFVTNQPDGVSLGGTGFGQAAFGTASTGHVFAIGSPIGPGNWYCQDCGVSLEFTANFATASTVSEPTPLGMFSIPLLVGLGLAARRNGGRSVVPPH